MNKQKGFTVVELVYVILFFFSVISWVVNGYKFTQCDFEAPYKAEIIYGLGVATPLCLVTAWVNVGK